MARMGASQATSADIWKTDGGILNQAVIRIHLRYILEVNSKGLSVALDMRYEKKSRMRII